MRIARSLVSGAIALASISAGCTSQSRETPPARAVGGVTEEQAHISQAARETRARDLAASAEAQIRQLEGMRPHSVNLGVFTQIEAHIATISQNRDEVLADLGASQPERLDYDLSNLERAMRDATIFGPRPLVSSPPLVPHAGGQTGAGTLPQSR